MQVRRGADLPQVGHKTRGLDAQRQRRHPPRQQPTAPLPHHNPAAHRVQRRQPESASQRHGGEHGRDHAAAGCEGDDHMVERMEPGVLRCQVPAVHASLRLRKHSSHWPVKIPCQPHSSSDGSERGVLWTGAACGGDAQGRCSRRPLCAPEASSVLHSCGPLCAGFMMTDGSVLYLAIISIASASDGCWLRRHQRPSLRPLHRCVA